MDFLRRATTVFDDRTPDSPFDPNAPEAISDDVAVADQAADTIATRPEYYQGLPRTPLDPSGFLSDILAVLLGTYSGKHRPEQLNISPGAGGGAVITTHVRYHVTAVKGSNGAAGQIVDIKVGTEIIETIFNFVGGPFAYPASFWVDRGAQVSAVERAAAVNFSCILIASEAD